MVLGLFWCNVGFAKIENSVNHYTKQNYEIIEYRSVNEGFTQVITLKKHGHVIICSVIFHPKYMINKGTVCIEP